MNNCYASFLLGMFAASAVSIVAGVTGYFYEKRKTEKAKQENFQTFKEVYEDNAPKPSERSSRELMEEYFEDCGGTYPY